MLTSPRCPSARQRLMPFLLTRFTCPTALMRPAAAAMKKEQARAMQALLQQHHTAGKPVSVRIRDVRQIEPALLAEADVLYLGGELMGNRTLQDEVGRLNTPVVLCQENTTAPMNGWWPPSISLCAATIILYWAKRARSASSRSTLTGWMWTPSCACAKESHLPVLANITRLRHGEYAQRRLVVSWPPLRVLMRWRAACRITDRTPRPSESSSYGLWCAFLKACAGKPICGRNRLNWPLETINLFST